MDVAKLAFLILLVGVAIERLFELRVSRRHQLTLMARGAHKVADPNYRWMVLLHATVLLGAALEVIFLRRPFIPTLAATALAVFLLATSLRWWAIRCLGQHWNTEIVDSAPLGTVSKGPFRWVRHPNYTGVFAEMIALPLIHTAFLSAVLAAIGNAIILRGRVRVEERVLDATPGYRAAMAGKPRFLPKLF